MAFPINILRVVGFFTLSAISIISISCSTTRSAGENTGREEENAPIAVTVAQAELRDVPATIQATGSLVADETSDVAPRSAGKISNVSVNVGDFVTQGNVIAKIDDREARLALASARASVQQAVAQVRQAEARLGLSPNGAFNASAIPEVRAADANYQQMVAELRQAEANEKRYRELVETGDVAMITYEQYRTQRDTARARANSAKQQLDSAVNTARQNNQAIKSAEANVAAARTEAQTAEQALADTVIRAPFAGFVSERPVAVGEYVSSATVVARVLRTNPMNIEIKVAEGDLPFVTVGTGVSVSVDAYKDRNFAGTVTAVNPAVDPDSRSAVVEAAIENSGNALRAGMFGTVKINKQGGGKGVFVPKTAVHNDQATQAYRVFVVQEGVVKLRTVQLGIEEGEHYQIIAGVEANETVATSSLDQLFEGAKVVY